MLLPIFIVVSFNKRTPIIDIRFLQIQYLSYMKTRFHEISFCKTKSEQERKHSMTMLNWFLLDIYFPICRRKRNFKHFLDNEIIGLPIFWNCKNLIYLKCGPKILLCWSCYIFLLSFIFSLKFSPKVRNIVTLIRTEAFNSVVTTKIFPFIEAFSSSCTMSRRIWRLDA